MRTDDQYFKPGDKVMRVAEENAASAVPHPDGFIAEYGKVYCVSEAWHCPRQRVNKVNFVGAAPKWGRSGLHRAGWRASNFRKVEEIKLCVRAAEKARTPMEANH